MLLADEAPPVLELKWASEMEHGRQPTSMFSLPVWFLAISMMSQLPPNLSFFRTILYLCWVGSLLGSQGGPG